MDRKSYNYATEIFPECGIEFHGASVLRPGLKNRWKRCPNGHWTSAYVLAGMRGVGKWAQRVDRRPVKKQADAQDVEAALRSMLEGYARAVATLPPFYAGMVQGAFGKVPEIALEVLT